MSATTVAPLPCQSISLLLLRLALHSKLSRPRRPRAPASCTQSNNFAVVWRGRERERGDSASEGRKEGRRGETVCIDCLFRCSLQRISGRELPHEREGGESREIIIAMLALLPEPQFEFGTRPIIPATVVLLDSHTVARDTDATSPH